MSAESTVKEVGELFGEQINAGLRAFYKKHGLGDLGQESKKDVAKAVMSTVAQEWGIGVPGLETREMHQKLSNLLAQGQAPANPPASSPASQGSQNAPPAPASAQVVAPLPSVAGPGESSNQPMSFMMTGPSIAAAPTPAAAVNQPIAPSDEAIHPTGPVPITEAPATTPASTPANPPAPSTEVPPTTQADAGSPAVPAGPKEDTTMAEVIHSFGGLENVLGGIHYRGQPPVEAGERKCFREDILPSKLSNLPEFLELLAKNIWLLKQKGFAIIVVLETPKDRDDAYEALKYIFRGETGIDFRKRDIIRGKTLQGATEHMAFLKFFLKRTFMPPHETQVLLAAKEEDEYLFQMAQRLHRNDQVDFGVQKATAMGLIHVGQFGANETCLHLSQGVDIVLNGNPRKASGWVLATLRLLKTASDLEVAESPVYNDYCALRSVDRANPGHVPEAHYVNYGAGSGGGGVGGGSGGGGGRGGRGGGGRGRGRGGRGRGM